MLRDPQQMAQFVHDHCHQLQYEAENDRRASRHLLSDAGARRGARRARILREQSQSVARR